MSGLDIGNAGSWGGFRMNVLFINRFSFRFLGGVEFHIRSLGCELVRRGHRVTLACDCGREGEGEDWVDGLRVIRVAGLWGLRDFLLHHGNEFDVCHGHMSRKLFSMYGLFLAKRLRLPTIFTPHCFYPADGRLTALLKRLYDRTFTRATFRYSDRVINLTPRDQQDSFDRGLEPAKSSIIPNSIDLAKLQETDASDFRRTHNIGREYLLHVGRFQKQKCIHFLVRQQACIREFDLVLIGQDDGEMCAIRRLVLDLRLAGCIHILENLSFRDICGAYREAAVMVMASRNEGLPTVVLEAMAFGVPVVAPAVGGIPFVVEHGKNGFVYPWADGEAYRRCVREAVREKARIAENARAGLYERFSWKRNADRMLHEYSLLLGDQPLTKRPTAPVAYPLCGREDSKGAVPQ